MAVLVAASTFPTASASAEPCIVFDPPPPHLKDSCQSSSAQVQRDKCEFSSSTDVTREAGWQIGHIRGGPLVMFEGGSLGGTLVCEIHVNNNTHDGPAVVRTSYSAIGNAVVVGEPRVINYPATAADTISLCTEWHGVNGLTLYWRGGSITTGDLGNWSTTPTSCGEAMSIEPNWPT